MKLVKRADEAKKAETAYNIVRDLDIPPNYRLSAFEIILARLLSEAPQFSIEKPVTGAHPEPQKGAKPKSAKSLLPDRIMELAPEGFFNQPKSAGEIRSELRNRGYAYSFASVGMALLALLRRRELRRILEKKGDRTQYLYTNP